VAAAVQEKAAAVTGLAADFAVAVKAAHPGATGRAAVADDRAVRVKT
jgi:hypothetical protein